MPKPDGPELDLPRLISVLDHQGVEYLVIGGAAAVAYGAERPTQDADCVVRRNPVNLEKLAAALKELNARLRVAGIRTTRRGSCRSASTPPPWTTPA